MTTNSIPTISCQKFPRTAGSHGCPRNTHGLRASIKNHDATTGAEESALFSSYDARPSANRFLEVNGHFRYRYNCSTHTVSEIGSDQNTDKADDVLCATRVPVNPGVLSYHQDVEMLPSCPRQTRFYHGNDGSCGYAKKIVHRECVSLNKT